MNICVNIPIYVGNVYCLGHAIRSVDYHAEIPFGNAKIEGKSDSVIGPQEKVENNKNKTKLQGLQRHY